MNIRCENRRKNLIEEGVDCSKHRTNDEELQCKECDLIKEESEDANLANATVLGSFAANHVDKILNNLRSAKHGSIHPTTALLHEYHH